MEEAAQEVRRILRHNDVEESLHYLSTVTRSIEANQHDLRAIYGNSYRDLLNACDGVVGMEQDCADILTIEEAIERVSAAHDTDGHVNPEVDAEPLLPPSWFYERLRRQRRAAAAAVTTTIRSSDASFATPSRRSAAKGYAVTDCGKRGEGTCDAETAAAAREGYSANAKKTSFHSASALPVVELPLSYATSADTNNTGTLHRTFVDEDTDAGTLAAQRMRLGDELQALHLDYMTLAAATVSMKEGSAAVDTDLRSLLSNSSTLASLSLSAPQQDEVPYSHGSRRTGQPASDTAARDAASREKREDILCALERDLPLLRLARRLSRVQASLRVYAGGNDGVRSSTSVGDTATASSAALTGLSVNHMRFAKRPPSWVADFERRAAALEVRLVQRILQRLRRAAHHYACLAEQRNRLAQQVPRDASGTEATESSPAMKAMRAAENRYLVYVWVTFAQCHGAVRALRDSPTLVSALVACAPGAALPVKRALQPAVQGMGPAASSAANMSLHSAVDALFQLASRDVQSVVSTVMHGATPLASAHVGPTAGDTMLPCAADPCRVLLAFLAVLLLRESQLSAMRWAAVAPSCFSTISPSVAAQAQTVADASPRSPSFFPGSGVGTQCTVAAASRRSDGSRFEGDAAWSLPSTAPPEANVFATATHLSALGLATAADSFKTSSEAPVAAGGGTPNTTWALRCFSGLSYLLRAFADYADLVQAASLAAPSVPEALDEETIVLRLLQGIYLAEEAASEDQLWTADHSDAGAVSTRQDDEHRLFTPPTHAAGARSLDELLQWRLRHAGGCVVASSATGDSSGTPRVSLTVADGSIPSSLVGSSASLMTPVRGLYSVTAASLAPGAVPQSATVTRRRAFVELLRASVNTVDELQASGASSATASERLHSGRADSAVTGVMPAASGETDLLSPLRFVCQELLAPCVSSLVVLLARDPVALAVYNGGQSSSDMAPARDAVRDALRRLLQRSSLSGTPGPEMPLRFPAEWHAWATVNAARWWEVMEQSTMDAALQRCVTVALESVSFVDACVAQGLVASAFRMLQSSAEVSNTELAHGVSDPSTGETASHIGTGASALERTWSALFSVLRLHALSSGGSVSRAGEAGACEGAAGGCDVGAEQRSAQRSFEGTSSVPGGGNCGCRPDGGSLISVMTDICWERFRPRTAAGVTDDSHRSLSAIVSEGIFREEGLEWGRAACRAVQLPFSAIGGIADAEETGQPQQTPDAAAASSRLSASQQAQLAKILSGMRDMLLPTSKASCRAALDVDHSTRPGAFHMNGHAAELLQWCLSTLVNAVQAQTAAGQTLVGDTSVGSPPSTPPPPLHMRIVGWLEGALHRVAVQLRKTEAGATASGANATVVHSYELSLLVRVYSVVLQRLQMATLPSEATRVRQLCAEAEDLYERTQAPWQDMLAQYYRAALQQAYTSRLRPREGAEEEPEHSAASSRSSEALRRMAYVMHSTAWVRAPMGGRGALHGSSASESPGAAYPVQPTPAVMTLTQTVLRHLHQALYGAPSVFSDSPALLMSFESGAGVHSGVAAVSGQVQGTTSAAASGGFSGASTRCLRALLTEKEQRRVLARLTETSAKFYECELCSIIDWMNESGDSASTAPAITLRKRETAPVATAATQSQADVVRLQCYMDVLFTSSVWCAGSCDGSNGGNSAGLLASGADSPAKALFASDTGAGGVGVDAEACVADGPLRRVVCRLESTCDPVRWRSGVPLVLAAYRQFISASALLWVVRSEEPHHASLVDTRNSEACCGPSVAAAAASKPFVAAGGTTAAPLSTEWLFLPREQADRLALLPISVSSNAVLAAAAAASTSMRAGNASSAAAAHAAVLAPLSYSLLPPTASALTPHPPSSASSTGVPTAGLYRFAGSSSAVAAATGVAGGAGMSSFRYPASGGYDASTALMLGGVGAADVMGVSGATVPSGSSSAATAASLLWGTTQRGWSQLWSAR